MGFAISLSGTAYCTMEAIDQRQYLCQQAAAFRQSSMEDTMPKQWRMFAGITRQVVISDETHQLLRAVAEREKKYLGELADEILRSVLTQRLTQARTAHSTHGNGYRTESIPPQAPGEPGAGRHLFGADPS
jgi:hypothetical protein